MYTSTYAYVKTHTHIQKLFVPTHTHTHTHIHTLTSLSLIITHPPLSLTITPTHKHTFPTLTLCLHANLQSKCTLIAHSLHTHINITTRIQHALMHAHMHAHTPTCSFLSAFSKTYASIAVFTSAVATSYAILPACAQDDEHVVGENGVCAQDNM